MYSCLIGIVMALRVKSPLGIYFRPGYCECVEAAGTVATRIPRRRADQGTVRLNTRDLHALEWIFDMHAVFETDLPDVLNPARLISKNAARSIVTRWANAGVAYAEPVLANQGRLVRLTPDGERLVSTGDRASPVAAPGAAAAAVHHAMVARARLRLERDGLPDLVVVGWLSERQWRMENRSQVAAGEQIPDGIARLDSGDLCPVHVGHTGVEFIRIRSTIMDLLGKYGTVIVAVPGDIAPLAQSTWNGPDFSGPGADHSGLHLIII